MDNPRTSPPQGPSDPSDPQARHRASRSARRAAGPTRHAASPDTSPASGTASSSDRASASSLDDAIRRSGARRVVKPFPTDLGDPPESSAPGASRRAPSPGRHAAHSARDASAARDARGEARPAHASTGSHAAPPAPLAETVRRNTGPIIFGVIALVSVIVLLSGIIGQGDGGDSSAHPDTAANVADAPDSASADPGNAPAKEGPVPGTSYLGGEIGALPPGGPYAQRGSGDYRPAGQPGERVGEGRQDTFTYAVEVETSVDAAGYGGDDAFAAMVDATLSNPKSWAGDPNLAFQHVDPARTKPDLLIQLTSAETTHDICGNSYQLETSCYMPIGNRVVINESRWVRGALPFNGDLGAYRQYVINHEVGHAIGYAAHQPCTANGALAPIMMQQTLSLNNKTLHDINPNEVYDDSDTTCRPNPWPFPLDPPTGQPAPAADDAAGQPRNRER